MWEWVEDWYHDSYEGASHDGSAWVSPASDVRVIRGGSWKNTAGYLRAAGRLHYPPSLRHNNVGFRLCR